MFDSVSSEERPKVAKEILNWGYYPCNHVQVSDRVYRSYRGERFGCPHCREEWIKELERMDR